MAGGCFGLLLISPALGRRYKGRAEKGSPYECGFDPIGVGYLGFSVRYFLIAIIFLIFDVEIALLLPIMVISVRRLFRIWGLVIFLFLLALILGTFYEWKDGALD